jgi:activator of HSP90 ATPase
LMDSNQHAGFTGAPAEISRDAGGTFSCHGGQIVGRNIELVPDRRIVQAWRVANWDDGVYSLVRFEMSPSGSGTKLVLDQSGFPEGQGVHLAAGWNARYWEPMKRALA